MPPLLTVTHPKGIYLPEADLWLDPHFGVERAFISHAHSDHVARHQLTFSSELTLELMRARYGVKESSSFQALPMRQVFEWEGWKLRLFPAGHIVGSAMLHLTRIADGATLLYTGDYKLRQGLSSERCELLHADTLIMETTFGLPQFRFPPTGEIVASMLKWVRETLDDGGIPVLLGYSLGKAQEILCALGDAGLPVMVHKSILEMTEVVAPLLGKLPAYRPFVAAEAKGHVLLFPPSGARSLAIRKLKTCRTAMLSGWAMQPGAKYRYQVDEVFPLSDHADYPELLETVETVSPRRVYLVHGYTQEFAADLRARGYEAWTLERADQLEIQLGQPKRKIMEAGAPAVLPESAEGKPESFAQWAYVCAQAAAESSRLKKVSLLADYLRALEQETDLELAVRYCSGLLFDPAGGEGPLNTGWAVIRRSLQELSGLSDAEYRTLSRSQADAGRTAYLVLSRCPLVVADMDLQETAHFFRELREARGPLPKTKLLRERLAHLSAHTGSWLVRLMTGELRMGSKEGLIEEAIATAFQQPADAVREAAMLSGDIGRAAVLARQARLHEAVPRPMVPIKIMLATPEETAADIWQRMLGAEPDGAGEVWLEDKYDGIRAQLHRSTGKVEIYTRDLKPIGVQFPEITQAAVGLHDEVIMDGEIIAYAEDKKLSFFDLQKRLGRRDQADLFLPSDISVRYVVFDLLWKNGSSLLSQPLAQRRLALESVTMPPGMTLIDVHHVRSEVEIEAAFMAARRRNNEGLIAKDPATAYTPGRRGKAWLKLKKAFATLDVVVVKAEQGHGKRSHVLSDYTFAVRDEHGALRVIGKAYSGLTDAEIETLTEHFTSTTLQQKGSVRTVIPDTVLEIAFDSIQASTRHDSGLSLRFPRIKAIRTDKTPEDIDTLAYARKLAGVTVS
ncbi:DNA ligase-1 [Prosthecobacter fusiformis]|uniref:DNA ligase n=1 Tax=Prosthecobacter fusiformis TaxID=48464 RepID=A0A4R7S196_9BACT|nr:ATP-dependent DNA ligase [Prosthecobacter fusiformis]TDU71246.1 DNA ligase-1 [Prosthecobacter fusiformis]